MMPLPQSIMRRSGFSIIELVVVLGVTAVLVASLGGAMSGLRHKDEVKRAALEFQSMITEANRIARMERTPVRLAFLLPEDRNLLESAGVPDTGGAFKPGCGLMRFTVPGRHVPMVVRLAPLDGAPPVPLARSPRVETMVGRWQTGHGRLVWKRWSHRVVMGGQLIDDWKSGGARYCEERYQIHPPHRWSATDQGQHHPLSVYPMDFGLSPYQSRLEIVTGALPDDGAIQMKSMPAISPAELYGDADVPHWQREDGRPFGERQPDEALALPAIDFNEDGSLARRDVDELLFHFSETDNPRARWTVHVRTRDAHTWIE